jgi:very-short-patch-repair endonuclease
MSHFNRTPAKTKFARRLRRDGTTVERQLWQRLRNRHLGDAQKRRVGKAAKRRAHVVAPNKKAWARR